MPPDYSHLTAFSWLDILMLPILVLLLYLFYAKNVIKPEANKRAKKYFALAFWFKVFCAIFHLLIMQFYYNKVSDAFTYYNEISNIKNQISLSDKVTLWDFYFNRDFFTLNTGIEFDSFGSNVNGNLLIFTLPVSYLFFNSFLCISFFLGFIALLSCHKIYIVFLGNFPNCKMEAIIAAVLLPGVTFWSSILLKDTLSLIGLGYGLWFFWKIFILKKITISNIVGFTISMAFVYYFKPYILVIIFSFFLWYGLSVYNSIKKGIIRFFSLAIFSSIFILLLSYALNKLNDLETGPLAGYKAENFVKQMEGFQQVYASAGEETSSFSLGDIDFNNPLSLLSAAPRALSSVYFQPFIWEAKKPIMLLSAFESLLIFYLFLFALFKTKVFGLFAIIFKNPFLASFFVFCLFFGTIVAFAAPNFGTLARYKIPCMPFMVFILLVVRKKIKDKKIKIPDPARPIVSVYPPHA